MDSLKELQTEFLIEHGLLKKEIISEEEYEKLRELNYEYVFAETNPESWDVSCKEYYCYRVQQEYTSDDIKKIFELENNKALNDIKRNVRTIKDVILFGLVIGVVSAVIWIIYQLGASSMY